METESESDQEFWDQLEDKPKINALAAAMTRRMTIFPPQHDDGDYQGVQAADIDHPTVEHYKRKLELLRQARLIDVENTKKVVKHKARNHFRQRTIKMQNDCNETVNNISDECDELKCKLIEKDKEINWLSKRLNQADHMIFSFRIRESFKQSQTVPPSHTKINRMLTRKLTFQEQSKKITAMEEELKASIEICRSWQDQLIYAQAELANSQAEVAQLKNINFSVKQQMKNKYIKDIQDGQKKIDELQYEIKSLKLKFQGEVKLQEEINARHVQMISILQTQLRTAKEVITNPRKSKNAFKSEQRQRPPPIIDRDLIRSRLQPRYRIKYKDRGSRSWQANARLNSASVDLGKRQSLNTSPDVTATEFTTDRFHSKRGSRPFTRMRQSAPDYYKNMTPGI